MLSFHIKTRQVEQRPRYVPIEDDNVFSGRIPFVVRPDAVIIYYNASSHHRTVFEYDGSVLLFNCTQI